MSYPPQSTLTPTQNVKSKKPVLVVIIGGLMLLGGIGNLLVTLPLLLIGGLGRSGALFGLGGLSLIKGVGLVVVSFGIRQMRRWALYALITLTVLGTIVSIYSFMASQERGLAGFADTAIQIIMLLYFWSISEKFSE